MHKNKKAVLSGSRQKNRNCLRYSDIEAWTQGLDYIGMQELRSQWWTVRPPQTSATAGVPTKPRAGGTVGKGGASQGQGQPRWAEQGTEGRPLSHWAPPRPEQNMQSERREDSLGSCPSSPSSLSPLPPGAGYLGSRRQENLGAVGAVLCHRVSREAGVGPRQTGHHLHRCSAEDSQDTSLSGKNQSSLGQAEGNQGPESHGEGSALLGASSFSSSCNRWGFIPAVGTASQPHIQQLPIQRKVASGDAVVVPSGRGAAGIQWGETETLNYGIQRGPTTGCRQGFLSSGQQGVLFHLWLFTFPWLYLQKNSKVPSFLLAQTIGTSNSLLVLLSTPLTSPPRSQGCNAWLHQEGGALIHTSP